MKTDLLLGSLAAQLARLETEVAPVAQQATLGARFDRQLFTTRSPYLQACVEEARGNLQALGRAVEREQLPRVQWLAERLVAQLEAIARESKTWSLRGWDSGSPALTRWQRRRLQHQEYERRLLEIAQSRRAMLAKATTLDEQQRLSREVEACGTRLSRCREALAKIENRLARMTR
ncbi:primosomal replication protein N'' [uncultured Pluralibacter sp.]|uniref:primosomal replication protein N'' n=1 Tax=uncultured Pluralibacter sp. TaxID=1490864 RepID=UPI00260E41D7|nr:primosomal replication protein N'' [uncultured Pluralibacter sp.]